MDQIWFTADTHFGHGNIIKYCNRPFLSSKEQAIYDAATIDNASDKEKESWNRLKLSKESVDRHDKQLIDNWNDRIAPGDRVYHLGDFFFGSKYYGNELMDSLNGQIFLIYGNHDKSARLIRHRFIWTKDYFELKVDDKECKNGRQKIILLHYAMRVWNASHYASWHLYGHSHGNLPDDPEALSIDIGVDAVAHRYSEEQEPRKSYRPMSYDEVKKIITAKKAQIEPGRFFG